MTARVFTIYSLKGGTGKTTSAINIGAYWARHLTQQYNDDSPRILVVDLDAQAQLTIVFLGMAAALGPRQPGVHTILEVFLRQVDAAEAVQTVELEETPTLPAAKLDIIPSHLELFQAEQRLSAEYQRELILKHALQDMMEQYDVIIFDCPTNYGIVTLNALSCSTDALIPVNLGLFPLAGISMLKDIIQMVQRGNNQLKIGGVIPTMQDRTNLARDTIKQLDGLFEGLILPAVPRRVAAGEAHSMFSDIHAVSPNSPVATAYAEITEELMRRG